MLKISVIVCTRDRPKDLEELLSTILKQSYPPNEVIIVDDSRVSSAKQVAQSFRSKFQLISCQLKYVKGSSDGLSAARNLGVKICEGDAVFFLDDDTLLDRNTLSTLVIFLRDNPVAMGVQPKIVFSTENLGNSELAKKLENVLYKVLMLSYCEKNKLAVRRSGASVLPNDLTKVVSAQRLSGCCCYRREVLNKSSFDTNLKRWSFMEDLDFSYRVYLKNPRALYTIPYAKIIHKASAEARLPTKLSIHMTTIYWFYIYFKDIFESSVLNLIAFLWALTGNLISVISGLIVKRKPKHDWWSLIYLLESYVIAFRNLRNILMQRLEFFNKKLK